MYPVPTNSDVRGRIEADFNTRLPGADSRLARGVLRVLSFTWARTISAVYAFLGWLSRQRLPDTADDEELDRFGGTHGLTRTAATTAAGTATVAGVNGSTVLAGAVLQTGDGLVTYTVQADVEIVGGAGVVALLCSTPGSTGNQVAGTTLEFTAPVLGVAAEATVVALGGGLDLEDDGSFRARILDHLRKPPQGGAEGDYEKWAKQIAGVTRAWERADWQGAGTVGVLFVLDGRETILPLADDVTALQAHLNKKRPITTPVYAVAPVFQDIALTIALNPSNDAVKAAVQAELDDLFARSVPDAMVRVAHIRAAIGLAVGSGDWRQTVPAADVDLAPNALARRGVITWAAW